MKLEELARDDQDLRIGIAKHLDFAGLKELHSYVSMSDDGMRTAYVATDAGLYVAEVISTGVRAGTVKGTLTPWAEVVGTRIVFADFRSLDTVLVTIAMPAFRESTQRADSTESLTALVEFATLCTQRQGRWAITDATSANHG